MSDFPPDLRREIVAEVYRRAAALDWEGLTDRQRSTMYDRWLDEPSIGGQLTRFLSRERARVWLKDVPMKEYARARNGIGPFSDLVVSRFPGPGEIARQVLNSSWNLVDGTIREKPNRCEISSGDHERLMIWGPRKTLRDMVWAGINAVADREPEPLLVVTYSLGQAPSLAEKNRHALLKEITRLDITQTVIREIRTS